MSEPESGLRKWIVRLKMRSSLHPEDETQLLNLTGLVRTVPAGRDFVRLGTKADRVTLVLSGMVAQFGQRHDGGRDIVAVRLPGEMADLQSAVLPKACCAQTALVTSDILRIPHSAIHKLLSFSPRLAAALWRDVSVDGAIVERWLIMSRAMAAARLAHLICELGMRHEVLGGTRTAFPFPLTQAQLGDAVGLTGVHVNRTFRLLRNDNLLRFDQREVKILDWQRLTAVAGFDTEYLHLNDGKSELE